MLTMCDCFTTWDRDFVIITFITMLDIDNEIMHIARSLSDHQLHVCLCNQDN